MQLLLQSRIKNKARKIVRDELKRITNDEILEHLLLGNE